MKRYRAGVALSVPPDIYALSGHLSGKLHRCGERCEGSSGGVGPSVAADSRVTVGSG